VVVRQVTVGYSDGTQTAMPVQSEQTILEAAEEHGIAIVNECQSGICGTCVATCTSGEYEMGRTEGLSDVEREARKILTCQTFAESACLIELQYPADDNAARLVTGHGVVTVVERVSSSTALLRVDVSDMSGPLVYKAGQFAQLQVPGTVAWRNYSYAHPADGRDELEFIIRLLPDGAMSDYLRDRAKAGDRIALRCSKGSFYLRPAVRPLILVAGGTGLSAILAMAQSLAGDSDSGTSQPVHLLYGVTHSEDLCKLDELEALVRRVPGLELHLIVARPAPHWHGPVGIVTDLLDDRMLNDGNADVYLCGPAAMVEATRTWLGQNGFHRVGLYYEKFVPSGAARRRTPVRLEEADLDVVDVRRRGRGTAVVIGGSMAGIAAAKVLSESFERVIVLEKDGPHRPREGRPGAAQGWHLHHLLTAGQIELERIFPGIVDDMVREGAFKVDMAAQYRIRLGGTWKKPGTSDIQIVCAGRPLLEWCVRRRLDDEPRIDFRYESEVADLVYDRGANTVVGVAVERDSGGLDVVPAEFVVDASGKNTNVPEFLDRIGVGAPEVEQDIINCFYSTMHHRVPPERQWQDKVMVICYAYRPYEDTYAAQYYTDSSRTTLSTSLVAYNCYSPPRTAREFREFADLMPSPVVGENIDGLEPASPIYNFRYPNMLRLRYEKKRNLPCAMVAVGDAYTSADPVSGLGMTLALKEVRELQLMLAKYGAGHPDLPRRYYRKISRMANTAWFVIREQNLRFDWIKDVDKKRPFYFRALTWYMDRVTELVHDDLDTYREFLAVVHLVKPPSALMRPKVAGRVIGKWARTRLSGQQTLIARNYQNRTVPTAETERRPEDIADLAGARTH